MVESWTKHEQKEDCTEFLRDQEGGGEKNNKGFWSKDKVVVVEQWRLERETKGKTVLW